MFRLCPSSIKSPHEVLMLSFILNVAIGFGLTPVIFDIIGSMSSKGWGQASSLV